MSLWCLMPFRAGVGGRWTWGVAMAGSPGSCGGGAFRRSWALTVRKLALSVVRLTRKVGALPMSWAMFLAGRWGRGALIWSVLLLRCTIWMRGLVLLGFGNWWRRVVFLL